jgi:hypothetical protein
MPFLCFWPFCAGGLDQLCSDFPDTYWLCPVEVDGQLQIVKDGWTNGNQSCTIDTQGCCTDDVLITDSKVSIALRCSVSSDVVQNDI